MTSDKKRQEIQVDKLDSKFTVTFTKRELLVINNVFISHEYKIGDAFLIIPILNKIAPFIKPDDQANGVTVK